MLQNDGDGVPLGVILGQHADISALFDVIGILEDLHDGLLVASDE